MKNRKGIALFLTLSLLFSLTAATPALAAEESWAIYWYLCGSDLETNFGSATYDLVEMLEVSLPDEVTVVIQAGGAEEWNNALIDSSAMYRMAYSGEELEVVEEVVPSSMGDADTLADFLVFCEENYPADKAMLLLWDHGGGPTGGICEDELFGADTLSMGELYSALAYAYGEEFAVKPLEIIGFDACLMASVEVAAYCAPFANYMVASEEIEPGNGWYYTGFLSALAENPSMDGAELGVVICDTYLEGCEIAGTDGEVTLSLVDLHNLDNLLSALYLMSYEGLGNAAVEPIAFFTQYGRAARASENYGGNNDEEGYTNLVDIGDLMRNTTDILPNTAGSVLESLDNCVVYSVNGPYRQKASGLSMFYAYDQDYESFESEYAPVNPIETFTILNDFMLTGDIDEGYREYLENIVREDFLSEDADDLAIGEVEPVAEYTPVSESTAALEDYPVEVAEDYSAVWMDLGAEAADALVRVTFMLAYIYDDGSLMLLGEDNDVDYDWEEGVFTDGFRGVWGSIDGNLVYMEVSTQTESYVLYSVPLYINGTYYDLSVSYDYNAERYNILTARPESEPGGLSPKTEVLLQPGDVITPLYYLSDAEGNVEEYEGEGFEIGQDVEFEEIELPDGDYVFMFGMTDYQNNQAISEAVSVLAEDGTWYMGME